MILFTIRDAVLKLENDIKKYLDFFEMRMYNTTEINTGELVFAG